MSRIAGIVSAAIVTLAMLTAPLAAEAQQTGKVWRIGFILPTAPVSEMAGPEPVNPPTREFVQGLRALGYVEGQNLILERRSAEGRFERFGKIVAELVRLKADVIVTAGDSTARAAKAVTTTVPIVMASSIDPVGAGVIQSLARPGGNITGLTVFAGPEMEAKRLELLREMLPRVSRVAYLASKEDKDWESPEGRSVRTAAQALGVTFVAGRVQPPSVHWRLYEDQSRSGRRALRLAESDDLRRSSPHRGLRYPDSATKHVPISGAGETWGFDVLRSERG